MNTRPSKKIRLIAALILSLLFIIIIINNSTTVLKLVYPIKYEDYVFKYSVQNNVDPYLVFAIIKAESSFRPDAVSQKNAKGLMQISEKTGLWGASSLKLRDYTSESLYDPEINIRIGCWYINRLMKEFNNDIDLVITAYNGGSGNVNEWLKDKNLSISGESLEKIPFKETDRFLKKVKNYHSTYKKLYEKDI